MISNMPDDQVTIFLTTPEAILFRDFQQFHKTFALLAKSGVFDISNGTATIHFGPHSEISAIVRNDKLYDSRNS